MKRITKALIKRTDDHKNLLELFAELSGKLFDIYESSDDWEMNSKWSSLEDRWQMVVDKMVDLDVPKPIHHRKEWSKLEVCDVFP